LLFESSPDPSSSVFSAFHRASAVQSAVLWMRLGCAVIFGLPAANPIREIRAIRGQQSWSVRSDFSFRVFRVFRGCGLLFFVWVSRHIADFALPCESERAEGFFAV